MGLIVIAVVAPALLYVAASFFEVPWLKRVILVVFDLLAAAYGADDD